MRPLSVRVPDDDYDQVERARHEAGQSRTDWLRAAITDRLAAASRPRPPEPTMVAVCTHPESKRIGTACVACGAMNLV